MKLRRGSKIRAYRFKVEQRAKMTVTSPPSGSVTSRTQTVMATLDADLVIPAGTAFVVPVDEWLDRLSY